MRTRWWILGLAFATACFESGEPGDRWVDPDCEECAPPACPEGDVCAEDAPGLRFEGNRARVCGDGADQWAAVLGRVVPLAAGGRGSLSFRSLTARDAAPAAITVATDPATLTVTDLVVESSTGTVSLEGVAPGVSRVEVRRAAGDLLIDRFSVIVAEAGSVRLAAPSQFGCGLQQQVLYRPVEVVPTVEVHHASGAVLVDDTASVTLADGAALAPVPAGVDRVTLAIQAAGASRTLDVEVVDAADRIERDDAARAIVIDQREQSTLLFRCFRATHSGREVVGATFEFSVEVDGRSEPLPHADDSPQCIRSREVENRPHAVLRVRAAGAERVEAL